MIAKNTNNIDFSNNFSAITKNRCSNECLKIFIVSANTLSKFFNPSIGGHVAHKPAIMQYKTSTH